MDLNDLNLKELRDLQTQVAKAIATFEDRRKKEALAELEETARSLGFSLAELTGVSGLRSKSASVAKYANPINQGETWSGRGRKPRWFIDAIEAGKSIEELAI
jgi:DNA-binding protein H-NS